MTGIRTPQISVVIPAFNAADFVLASVASVLDGTCADLEVICVDDGSTDDTAALLEGLAATDGRVSVVRLGANCGASVARNEGIERSIGAFLFFLDADDTVPQGALDLLLSAARQTQSELVIGKLLWFRTEAEVASPNREGASGPIRIERFRESLHLQAVQGCHCCNLYSRTLLEQHRIRYPVDLTYGEDQLFQATAMVKAEEFAMIDDIVYCYHHYRAQSVTRKPPSLKNLLDDIEFQRRIARLFANHGMDETGLRFLSTWSYSISNYWLQIPNVISRREASIFFSSFRAMAGEFGVSSWSESMPADHHYLLGLVMSGMDDAAVAFLAALATGSPSSIKLSPCADLS